MFICARFSERSNVMTRLSIELTEQQHQQIKAVAALQGQTIKQYAVARLLPMTADEKKAIKELKTFLGPRIEEALAGNVSQKTFDEIVEEELRSGPPA
jgi:hypothetical protein